ncbi:MAG: LPS-assembly protein LptD [Gemmatimonadaceae bacterium]|nr:LPS-assembly protein LptD [Gemmatimonadaceae bacterium]
MTSARQRWGARSALACAIGIVLAVPAHAQVKPPPKPDSAASRMRAAGDTLKPADTLRVAGADSVPRSRSQQDSTKARRNVVWTAPDSVMADLMAREGYSVTRYEGRLVEFLTKEHTIYLRGKPSQVERDEALLTGDTIRFNDSTKVVVATGDTLLLRDPAQGQDDIIALGLLRYDVEARRGLVRDVTTTVESGERWVVHGGVAAFKGDSATEGSSSAFYARNGWLTSCEETEPHYHFQARELKLVSKNIMVARPAVLYIADIPVAWLPFIFQDMRSGRRSGIIPPRFGFSDIVRNSTSYRRTIDDLGYYFALSDYMDLETSVDWRSDAGSGGIDPGWIRGKALLQYRWQDRFITGNLGVSYHYLKNGETNKEFSLMHQQEFSQRTRVTADLRYMTNTTVQRNTTFNPYQALGTISSRLNFTSGRGPFTLSLGGSQTQYPGRDELQRDFPSLSVTSKAIKVGEWLTWTPSLSASTSSRLHIDQVGDFAYRLFARSDGSLDSSRIDRSSRNSRIAFDTPIQLFGFNWRNSFNLADRVNDFPERRIIFLSPTDTSKKETRVYKRTYVTDLNWETSFSLPSFSQGKWQVSPNITFQKVDGRSGLFVRSERTGGKWVAQSLRPSVGLSISPTFYGFFPGFGPLSRIRHSVQTGLSYAYTPASKVSDEFLAANGDTRVGYLGDLTQNTVQFTFNTNLEGKLRGAEDSLAAGTESGQDNARKIKLLSVSFTSLAYDFERARITHKTGLSTRNFGYTIKSDLLPGIDFGSDYSLFQGDPISDTAVFKPYRERFSGSMSLGATSGIVRFVGRLLGFRTDTSSERGEEGEEGTDRGSLASRFGGEAARPGQSLGGSRNRASAFQIPSGQGWQLNLQYSATRQRPPVGSGVVALDPTAKCQPFKDTDPFAYQLCVTANSAQAGSSLFENTTRGGTFFRIPPQQSMQGRMSFHITDKWAGSWSTTYDFVERNFASQVVSLQRELHDWDAVFAFTKAPNGNFAFNFFIALKAEPDLKFNYDRRDYPRGYTGRRLAQ